MIVKNFYTTLFLFLSVTIFGQEKSSFAEVYIGPNYTGQTRAISNAEGVFTYTAGTSVIVEKNKKLHWSFGLRFVDQAIKNGNDDLRWGSQHDGSGGFDPNAPIGSLTGFEITNHYYFLQIPLGVKYYFLDGKVKLFIQPNLAPAFYLTNRNKITRKYNDRPDESNVEKNNDTDLRTVNFFGELGIGLEVPVSKTVNILFRPTGNIQILSAIADSETGARMYAAGVHAGMRYQIK